MKKRSRILRVFVTACFAVAVVVAWPAVAPATAPNNESATYEWHLELPNTAMASNGDTITLQDASGTFSTHPKSADGGGSFTHTRAGGGSASGTWTVDGLVDFQPYGCGVVFGNPLPPNFCGGRLSLDVTFHSPTGLHPGRVTIYCLIGDPPPSAEEGVRVVIPGIANFNKIVSGMNVYIKTS